MGGILNSPCFLPCPSFLSLLQGDRWNQR
jgi:hypothetical protein